MKLKPLTVKLLTLLVCIGLLAACGSSTDDEPLSEHPSLSPYWRDFFDKYLDMAIANGDDFVTDVLEDYWVTDAEWQAAQDLFYNCMADNNLQGYISTYGENVGVDLTPKDRAKVTEGLTGDEAEQAELAAHDLAATCTTQSIINIGLAYAGPRANPVAVTVEEATARCLTEIGRDDLAQIPFDELGDMYTAGSLGSEDAENCVINPTYRD